MTALTVKLSSSLDGSSDHSFATQQGRCEGVREPTPLSPCAERTPLSPQKINKINNSSRLTLRRHAYTLSPGGGSRRVNTHKKKKKPSRRLEFTTSMYVFAHYKRTIEVYACIHSFTAYMILHDICYLLQGAEDAVYGADEHLAAHARR